jgi:hypothetical protein
MPSIPGGQLPKETLTNFVGVNLRKDPLSLDDGELVRSVNADLHTELGVLRVRKGRQRLHPTQLALAPVTALFRHLGRRYQVAAQTLYRNFVPILTGLEGFARPTVIPYQPLNEDTTWSFIADRNLMRKDNGVALATWGLTAPVSASGLSAVASGVLTGVYGAVYTYARVVSGHVVHESNPSPSPTPVTLASQRLGVPVVASTDPQVTHIRIYRTVAGGTSYLFDQQVPNSTVNQISDQADDALGVAVETDNDPPPLASCAVEFQGHLWLCNAVEHPEYLYYSKRFRPESWPPDNFLKIGDPSDPLLSMVALTGVIGVFTALTKYRVFGSAATGFTALEALNSRGIASPNATTSTARGVAFVAKDGIWLTNFVEADQHLSQGIEGLFAGQTIGTYAPIDMTQLVALAEFKRRLYFGYRDILGQFATAIYSPDTQHWYHTSNDAHVFLYEEDTDWFTTGTTAGFVEVLEIGYSDIGGPITLDVICAPRAGGDRFARKGYEWLGVDAHGNAAWQIHLLVDGVSLTTVAVSGARRKRYARLPERTTGHQWQAAVAYSGQDAAALYSLEILETSHFQGQVWVEDWENPALMVQILPGSQGPLPLPRRRFTFLVLDADTSVGGIWEADLYVDGVVAASVNVFARHNKRLHVLPEGLTGYEWYTRVRYNGSVIPLMHTLDVLDTGSRDGQVLVEAWQTPAVLTQLLPGHPGSLPLLRRRFTFLVLDAEAGVPGGMWEADLFIDGVMVARVTIPEGDNKRLHALPEGLTGYEWYVRVRYSDSDTPTVRAVDVLDTGTKDGQVWIARDNAFVGTYASILPAAEGVNPFLKKRFLYLKADLEVGAGQWMLDLYIDEVLRQTVTIQGANAHDLHRLRPGLIGGRWRLVARYAGAEIPTLFRVQVISQELAVA